VYIVSRTRVDQLIFCYIALLAFAALQQCRFVQALLAPARLVYRAVGPAAMRRLEARLDFAGAGGKGLYGYTRTLAAAMVTALAGKA
jgi:hypothetical protein